MVVHRPGKRDYVDQPKVSSEVGCTWKGYPCFKGLLSRFSIIEKKIDIGREREHEWREELRRRGLTVEEAARGNRTARW